MRKIKISYIVYAVIAGLFLISLSRMGLLSFSSWSSASSRLLTFASDLFPPRWDNMSLILSAVLETIEISFVGTILGFLMSLPLAFWGNKILFNAKVISSVRLFVGVLRTIPSILYGVIFVIAFGLGKAAGTVAVAFYTTGYLAKLYYEAFEAVDSEVIEAVKSTGCSRFQLFRFAIIPESANTIISQLLFMFEYNIRASTIMGFVGAGGIGYYMLGYVQMLQYQHLLTAFLTTLLLVMIIDSVSFGIRSKIFSEVPKK